MNTGRSWGKDDYFICGCPLPVVSKGIWSGDNPLNCIFPVLILQLIMGIFLSKAVYFILRPLRQSKYICSALGGILLGPSFIGVNGKIREVLFPPNETGVFNTFATIGTMYSFFIIALKVDMTMLFRISKSAWTIGLAGTILPWVTVLSLFYTQLNYLPAGLHPKVITFFVSANVSLTYFPMVGYALGELNLKTSELGHLAMSSALVTEVLQWFFVYVLAAYKQTNLEQAIETCVSSTIVVLFTIYAIRPALISVIKRTPEGTEVDEVYVYIDEPTFAVLVFSSLAITSIIAPLTEMLYKPEIPLDPSKKYRRLKTIHSTPRTSELRVISCVHNEENVHSLINLLEASNPTELSPICAYVIHLVELTGRTAPLLIPYNAKMKRVSKLTSSAGSDHILRAFENYSKNSNGPVIVQLFTMIVPYKTMHDDICRLALDKQTPLIIVPYHENLRHIQGSRVATSIRAFNTNLQMHAPCTVGILVDKGSRHMNSSQFSYNVVVIFIGGEDDRQALGYAMRMSGHSDVSLTILRITLHLKKEIESEEKHKGKRKGKGKSNNNSKDKDKNKDEEVDEEMEMLMDEVLYDEFKIKNLGNACVACREVEAENSAQVMDAIRSLDKNYDLVMVGLNRHQALELGDIEMPHNDAKNIEDLGMIGDVLVSSDFSMGWLSLLVLHHCGAPNHVRT
ncbi:cation/h(+) antiporter 15 [Fagus crenata]